MKIKSSYGIHWFRRDLRVQANPALIQNLKVHSGRVVGIFFFDSQFLSREDFSHNRFGFFLKTLQSLRNELQEAGGELLVLDSPPQEGFRKLFDKLKPHMPTHVSFNRDYEPFARNRDQEVHQILEKETGIPVITAADHLLIEPDDIRRPDGGTYQVFTPFWRTWIQNFSKPSIQERLRFQKVAQKNPIRLNLTWKSVWRDCNLNPSDTEFLSDKLDEFCKNSQKNIRIELPDAGTAAAQAALSDFKDKLQDYAVGRDFPALQQTSRLSIFLKNGSLTTAQVFLELANLSKSQPFLRQLVWREFYYYILYHHPRVEHEAFKTKYRDIKWQNRQDWFEAWKSGTTGFPIVDAGMRELSSTGLMHNRIRMVVSSFLTKDLLIDWKWGEKWFMQNLLDGDLAPNNGGWQWAASTGCDPQPYFRIFNPLLQSKKFDPDGDYIRKYMPELRELSNKQIHEPKDPYRPSDYPNPIVDHSRQRIEALKLFT